MGGGDWSDLNPVFTLGLCCAMTKLRFLQYLCELPHPAPRGKATSLLGLKREAEASPCVFRNPGGEALPHKEGIF